MFVCLALALFSVHAAEGKTGDAMPGDAEIFRCVKFRLGSVDMVCGRQVIEDAQIVEKRMEKDTAGNPQSVQDLYETTTATVIGFFVHNTANSLFKGDLGSAYKQYVALVL